MHDDAAPPGPSPARSVPAGPPVPPALAANMRQGWAPATRPPAVVEPVARFAALRRRKLVAEVSSTVLVCAGRPQLRNGDQYHQHRCATEFLYLVGAPLQDAVLVLSRDREQLFVRRPTVAGDDDHWLDRNWGGLWEGPRPRPEDVAAGYGLEVRDISGLRDELGDALPDGWVAVGGAAPGGLELLDGPEARRGSAEVVALLDEQRLVKDDFELSELAAAVRATESGFHDLARELAPGVSERWLEGCFWRRARHEGQWVGYHPIVAAGSHACVLHWFRNDGVARDGDALLVDAGVELASGYTADITRVLPVGGTFSAVQRRVLDAVDDARAAAVAAVAPGATLAEVHRAAMSVLCGHLLDWGLATGSVEGLLESGLHRRWTLHGTSHMLGLDVHDCAAARQDAYQGPLAEGMVHTVEPGLYFQPDDETVPEELRGVGMRLEDDVVVRPGGVVVLSGGLPRRGAETEHWLASLR